MLKCVTFAAVLVACFGVARGQDGPAKVEQLKKEIAELRAKLEAKEAELSKLVPAKRVVGMHAAELTIGEAGPLVEAYQLGNGRITESATILQVERVLGANKFVAQVGTIQPNSNMKRPSVIVSGMPTTGLADGKILRELPHFRVVGIERLGDRTLYVIEPFRS